MFAIGAILARKVALVRQFESQEATMIPKKIAN
jgi:hypothetical protein